MSSCPYCGSTSIRRTRRSGVLDRLCAALARFPYRCGDCKKRFRLRRERLREAPRAESRRRRAAIQAREVAVYLAALAAFSVIALFLTAEHFG